MLVALQISAVILTTQSASNSVAQSQQIFPTVFVVKGPVSDPIEKMKPKPRFRFTLGSKSEIQSALRMEECEVPIGGNTVVVLPTEYIKNLPQTDEIQLLKEIAFLESAEIVSKTSNPQLHKKLTDFALKMSSPQEMEALSSPDSDGEFRVSPTYVVEINVNGKATRVFCEAPYSHLPQPRPSNAGHPFKEWRGDTPPPVVPTKILNYSFLSNLNPYPALVARDAWKAMDLVSSWVERAFNEDKKEMCKTGGLAPLDSSKPMTLKDIPEPFRTTIQMGLQLEASRPGSPLNRYFDHPERIQFKPIRRGAVVKFGFDKTAGTTIFL